MFRGIVSALIMIIAWMIACYGLIIWKAPHLKDEFDKIIPYQGFLGIIVFLMGLKDLFSIVTIFVLFKYSIFFALLSLAILGTKLVLWFVLSYGLVAKYVLSKKGDTKEKTDSIYKTLTMVQVPFGIISIILGIIGIIINIVI